KEIVEPRVLTSLSSHAPEQALGYFLYRAGGSDWSQQMIAQFLRGWIDENPDSLYAEIMQTPESPRRDVVLDYFIKRRYRDSPAEAEPMVTQISDPVLKQHLIDWLATRSR